MVVYAGWDEYLFKQHSLVAVDPLTSSVDLELLNVLTKRGTYGVVYRGPVLGYTGSLTNLTLEGPSPAQTSPIINEVRVSEPPGPSSVQTSLNEVLQARVSQSGTNVTSTFKATSRIMASMMKLFGGDVSSEKDFTVKIESVTIDSIKQDDLVKLVSEGRWKPDLKKSQMPKNWDGVLWVIKEIKYAKKIIIGQSAKGVLSVKPKGLASVLSDIADLSAEVKVEKAKDGTTVYTAPGDSRFPFGFKAIRLEYNQEGNLLAPGGIEFGLDTQRPKVRAEADAWLNPDNDPEFHMKGLFTQEPEHPLESLLLVAATAVE